VVVKSFTATALNAPRQVKVVWVTSNPCPPVTGYLAVTMQAPDLPHWNVDIAGESGTYIDTVPVQFKRNAEPCVVRITYFLKLSGMAPGEMGQTEASNVYICV
jgi:hypothetical protein